MAEQVDPVLTDTQNWAARSHPELYAAVHNNNDPGQTGEIGSEWARYGAELTESARTVTERVAATETGWTGTSADGARAALKQLADWLTETAQTAVEVGDRVADQGQVMASARANMPEPVGFTWTDATQNLAAPGLTALVASAADVQAANDKARSAHAQAVTVMSSMEQSSRTIDVTTPVFTPPFNPVTGKTEEPPMRALQTVQGPTLARAPAAELTTRASSVAAVREGPTTGGAAPAPAPAVAGFGGGPDGFGERQPLAQKDFTTTAAAAPPITPTGGPEQRTSATHTSGTTGQALPPTGPVPTGTRFEPRPSTSPVYSTGNGSGTGPSGGRGGPSGTAGPSGGTGGGPGAVPGIGSGTRGGSGGAVAFSGSSGGAAAFGGPSGAGPMQSGGSTGVMQGNQQAQPGRGPMAPGATGPGAAAAMGGAMGAGGGARSEEDKEHRSPNYIISGDLFDMPADNLPPAVIGGAKKKDKS